MFTALLWNKGSFVKCWISDFFEWKEVHFNILVEMFGMMEKKKMEWFSNSADAFLYNNSI